MTYSYMYVQDGSRDMWNSPCRSAAPQRTEGAPSGAEPMCVCSPPLIVTGSARSDVVASFSIGRFAVANHHDAVACQAARPRTPTRPGRQTRQTAPAGQRGSANGAARVAGQHLSRVAARRRPLGRWLLVGLLCVFSLAVTAVYVATVIIDVRQHHWAGAFDASRDAVPAAVGWSALLILFSCRGAMAADEQAAAERHLQAASARDSVSRAEQRVERLGAILTELSAKAAQDAHDRQLARQIGDTAARLNLARQWLIGARAALAASQPGAAKASGTQPGQLRGTAPPAGRVALLARSAR